MNQMDFHSYQEVTGQKYMGIATVNYNGVMLRFKLVHSKDGTSFFPASASYNIGSQGGVDRYISAFCIDSNMANEMLKEMIMQRVSEYYHTLSQSAPMKAPPSNVPYMSQPQQQAFQPRDIVNVNQPMSAIQPQEDLCPF